MKEKVEGRLCIPTGLCQFLSGMQNVGESVCLAAQAYSSAEAVPRLCLTRHKCSLTLPQFPFPTAPALEGNGGSGKFQHLFQEPPGTLFKYIGEVPSAG